MARQEDACRRCGAQWATEDVPSKTLRATAGGQRPRPVTELGRPAVADDDRWENEGGSVGPVPADPTRAVAATG
jgi:hypothetical protein